jgi:hypothetical protein
MQDMAMIVRLVTVCSAYVDVESGRLCLSVYRDRPNIVYTE